MTEQNATEPPRQEDYVWEEPKATPAIEGEQLARWQRAVTSLRAVALRDRLSKSEVARRSDIKSGTFSGWYNGTYKGLYAETTARALLWLEAHEERLRVAVATEPGFVETPTAREIIERLIYAQAYGKMAKITLGAGMGKTTTARHFCATRSHAHVVTMRPTTTRVHAMLQAIATKLDVRERSTMLLDSAIGERLRRRDTEPLLIIDEAQILTDEAVNQLRYYRDEYGAGIALIGNHELHGRFGGDKPTDAYAQLQRRLSVQLYRLTPLRGDVDAMVAAWGISDPAAVEIMRKIGMLPGALAQVSETLILAETIARGAGQPLSAVHVRQAAANRFSAATAAAAAA